jgi:hypothetical protein
MEQVSQRADARTTTGITKAHSAGTSKRRAAQLLVRFRVSGDDPLRKEREATGQFAWALLQLHRAGKTGITSLENPAPRLRHYVYGLRRDGLDITTDYEDHGGTFAGRHGRDRLTTPIEVIEIREPEGRRNV